MGFTIKGDGTTVGKYGDVTFSGNVLSRTGSITAYGATATYDWKTGTFTGGLAGFGYVQKADGSVTVSYSKGPLTISQNIDPSGNSSFSVEAGWKGQGTSANTTYTVSADPNGGLNYNWDVSLTVDNDTYTIDGDGHVSVEDVADVFGGSLGTAAAALRNRGHQIDAEVDAAVNGNYRTGSATRAPIPRDPLAIDLDGDGIETVGVGTSPVLFDHNADGIRTGTGWVKGDDGWLVWDRNGNGLIDSGRELFGVDTLLSGTPGVDATYARSGFEALKTLDTNGDNLFNASDAAFAQVRIWQDTNQDGISQANELFTLAQKNIASIGLTASNTTQNLGNGNTVSGTATVTRTNGTTTLAETVSVAGDTTAANLFLGVNPFYRQFTDTIAPTTQAQNLPNMRGSGWVRDLREAMSGGNTYSQALTNKVQEFAQATTKAAQMALLNDVIGLWSATNSVRPGVGYNNLTSVNGPSFVVAGDPATSAKLQACIPVLEVFNGMTVSDAGMQAPVNGTYNLFANQGAILLQAYDALRESVYGALVMQTRLKPYLDAVQLVVDQNGVRFDTSRTQSFAITKASQDVYNTVLDLLELKKYGNQSAQAVGLDIYITLRDVLKTVSVTSDTQALLNSEHIASLGLSGINYTASNTGEIVWGNAANNVITGGNGEDQLYGFEGSDTLIAKESGDTLDGGDGDDALSISTPLYGGTGTTFIGGKGNDTMTGNMASDTYIFNLGDGQDTINEYSQSYYSQTDVLKFGAGILPADVTAVRSGVNLVLKVGAGGDQITVNNWFLDAGNAYQIEQIQFNDGTVWDSARIAASILTDISGTAGADTLTGTAGADNMPGLDGNDTLNAGAGHDRLDGGLGNDILVGGLGDDTYIVDSTADTVTENANEGLDSVISSVSWTLGVNLENLSLSGTAAINGTGNTLNNSLVGNSAANTLNGGAGADYMAGLGGNDIYVVDNVGDRVVENLNEGTDTVQSSVTWTLGANVENLTLTGTTAINGTGNELDNTLTGNSAANVLTGGAGNDTYIVGTGDTTVEIAGGGIDTVQSAITWTLGANVENLTLTGTTAINGTGNELDNSLTGNSAANVLTGGAGNDTLNGGAGADTLVGGTGNDTYVVDNTADIVTEALNEGLDLVQSSVTYTLSANVENLTLTGTTAINGTGNALDNSLTGNSAANVLTGGAGNDTLNGGAGADSLVGGIGNDTYWLGRGYGIDTITENDATAGNTDIARFDTGIAANQLWFTKTGNNLDVSIIGTSDKFTISNWYLGNQYHVEQFKTSDGKTLLDSQVQNLVSAMAAFAPPAAGQTTLAANYATALNPVIAANWQ